MEHFSQTTRRAIPVPLNDQAVAVIRQQIGKHDTHVFSYQPKGNKPRRPVKQLSTAAWYKALKRADIKNFRWHDLRHTFASWHRQNGTPLDALKELMGHSEISLTMRYAHITPEHLKEFAANSTIK